MLFRKSKYQQPMPPWMKWAALAFLGFAFLGSTRTHKNDANAPATIPETFQNAAKNLNPKNLLPPDTYQNIVLPLTNPMPQAREMETLQGVNDITAGTGAPAICGQKVTITYQSYDKDDKVMDSGQTLAFRIGGGKAMQALEQGVIGMKKDGKRMILTTSGRYETELLDISPATPDPAATPYRIATVTAGDGAPILCGNPGKFEITLWSADGKKLFSTKDKGEPVQFMPGQSEVFLGLEQGVIGMQPGETRTLIVPPVFQKTMDDKPPAIDFPLPKDQTVLVDIKALP